MALEGTLRDFSLADILQLISLQHKTGLLTVRGPADTVTLGFLDGMLVSAESSAQRLDTRLGTVLVKTRRLTAEALARALEMQAQTLQRLGFILLKNGFCSAQDLRDGLDIQIKRIAYGLFRWTDGDYVFEQTEHVDYDPESTTPIAVERLLMEGARMIDEWPIVEKVVWSLDIVYQKVPVAQPVIPAEDEDAVEDVEDSTLARRAREKRLDPIRVSRAEWSVYELVDGRRTVAEINELAFLSEFDGCKACFDLVSRGLIEESDAAPRGASPEALVADVPAHARPVARPLDVALLVGLVLAVLALLALQIPVEEPAEPAHAPAAARAGRRRASRSRCRFSSSDGSRRASTRTRFSPGGSRRRSTRSWIRTSWRRPTSGIRGEPTYRYIVQGREVLPGRFRPRRAHRPGPPVLADARPAREPTGRHPARSSDKEIVIVE